MSMKHHLVNLLYIQSKLYEIFEEEEIDYDEDTFDNFREVLDIIGFPQNNYEDYHRSRKGELYDPKKGKLMDDDLFSRDYHYQHFTEVISDTIQKVGNDEIVLKEQFTHFVNWLYKELENIKEERRRFPDVGLN